MDQVCNFEGKGSSMYFLRKGWIGCVFLKARVNQVYTFEGKVDRETIPNTYIIYIYIYIYIYTISKILH